MEDSSRWHSNEALAIRVQGIKRVSNKIRTFKPTATLRTSPCRALFVSTEKEIDHDSCRQYFFKKKILLIE